MLSLGKAFPWTRKNEAPSFLCIPMALGSYLSYSVFESLFRLFSRSLSSTRFRVPGVLITFELSTVLKAAPGTHEC